ncbi:MAG TPA: acyltransferase [Thermoanaerobaculia bacterium]|nr:acyltransferase [Thermoanaerobaculia bacterium]
MASEAILEDDRLRVTAPATVPRPGGAGRRHITSLDGLRGLAVLAVMVSHFYPEDRFPSKVLHCGRLGVVAFFALSGYLITDILLGLRDGVAARRLSRGRALRSFYGRRALRILPAYLLALGLCCLCGYGPVVSHLGWFLTYTVNFGQVRGVNFGFADHFWSLAVEEQFYLVWPALVLAVPACRLRGTIVGLVIAATGLNLAFAWSGASFLACFRLPFLGCLIPLGLGALLAEAEWTGDGSEVRRWLRRIFLGVGLPLLVATQTFWFLQRARTSWFYLGFVDVAFGLLSVATLLELTRRSEPAASRWLPRAFAWRPLVGLGKISYGVYVGHRLLMAVWPAALARSGAPPLPPSINLLALSACSIALAAISWFGVERPILTLKRKLPYGPITVTKSPPRRL